ncbi:MAG: GxxExxY protein [Candidatus Cloacimonetes bacterium]|nr:GxxExxY protein [Candidatus Cloacimonadota bacterium]
MTDMLYKKECYLLQGAIFNVYSEMGCGFLEAVYQECLEKEFELRKIPYSSQVELNLKYKSYQLKQKYYPDFICYNKIIVEIKALKNLAEIHTAQVINYLKITGFQLGLLENFGSYPRADIKRIISEKTL